MDQGASVRRKGEQDALQWCSCANITFDAIQRKCNGPSRTAQVVGLQCPYLMALLIFLVMKHFLLPPQTYCINCFVLYATTRCSMLEKSISNAYLFLYPGACYKLLESIWNRLDINPNVKNSLHLLLLLHCFPFNPFVFTLSLNVFRQIALRKRVLEATKCSSSRCLYPEEK